MENTKPMGENTECILGYTSSPETAIAENSLPDGEIPLTGLIKFRFYAGKASSATIKNGTFPSIPCTTEEK